MVPPTLGWSSHLSYPTHGHAYRLISLLISELIELAFEMPLTITLSIPACLVITEQALSEEGFLLCSLLILATQQALAFPLIFRDWAGLISLLFICLIRVAVSLVVVDSSIQQERGTCGGILPITSGNSHHSVPWHSSGLSTQASETKLEI